MSKTFHRFPQPLDARLLCKSLTEEYFVVYREIHGKMLCSAAQIAASAAFLSLTSDQPRLPAELFVGQTPTTLSRAFLLRSA